MDILKTVILGIVEGITEWLPVSSTGHLILVDEFIKLNMSPEFMSVFNVVIQLGAICAVLMIYFNKLNPFSKTKNNIEKKNTIDLWIKVIIAVIPSAILGLLYDDYIEAKFFNPTTVSLMLIIYGIVMIIMENRTSEAKIKDINNLTYKTAFFIGAFQCLALIPGTSRSASTIIGAVFLGASRFIATEFSFFLAIPTMIGASGLKLVKSGFAFNNFEWLILGVGTTVSFIVSVIVIKMLMNYIKKHDFKIFGYYRIVLGISILLYFMVK